MEGPTPVTSPPRKCRYALRQCGEFSLAGYNFCVTHILEDKTAPYEQCCYTSSKTGRRCTLPTKKSPKRESLCDMHATKINRGRSAIAHKQLESQAETAESLLEDLEHYSSTVYNNSGASRRYLQTESARHLADLASSSDSDAEDRMFLHQSVYVPDSGSESVDSEGEDVFKYAEVLTEEEATRITRDKLIKLQSLYIDQFKWLQYVLRERRRKYLLRRRKEREASRSAAAEDSSTASENAEDTLENSQSRVKKIPLGDDITSRRYLAMRRYHRKHKHEALMYMKSQERRRALSEQGVEGGHVINRYRHAPRHGTKYCSVKNIKCSNRSLPFTRYCVQHVQLDSHQVLYRRCGFVAVDGGLACERPVVNYHSLSRCTYHTNRADQALAVCCPDLDKSESETVEVVDDNKPTNAESHPTISITDSTTATTTPSHTDEHDVNCSPADTQAQERTIPAIHEAPAAGQEESAAENMER